MEQPEFGDIKKSIQLETWDKEELIKRYSILEDELLRVVRENYQLRNQHVSDEQIQFLMDEQLEDLRDKIFGSSSEKYKKSDKPKKDKAPPKPRIRKPSERYPNLPVVEKLITMDPAPDCPCCGHQMSDSGMTEDSEQLTVIPKKYEIHRQKRVKYACDECHGNLTTAPAPVRIKEGATYSDEMILDVALSKYCDLIPIERYADMAARSGVADIPPHSLIECTHYLADFVIGAYLRLKEKALNSRVLRADETPHRMLEGSDKKSWYLWGFSTPTECFFECHATRSGDVASEILRYSLCEILVSDVYSGYSKAIRIANKERALNKRVLIQPAYCNTHARRYFFKAWQKQRYTRDAEFYLECYHEIYKINSLSEGKSPEEILSLRSQMTPYFDQMKAKTQQDMIRYSSPGKLGKALTYFLGNYQGLTLFLNHPDVPIDNNGQEGLLRCPVVGRKTWYGTHSERGSRTGAILFSLVESCKLVDANPRQYFPALVETIIKTKKAITPEEFKKLFPDPQGPSG